MWPQIKQIHRFYGGERKKLQHKKRLKRIKRRSGRRWRTFTSCTPHSKHLFSSTGSGVWQYRHTGHLETEHIFIYCDTCVCVCAVVLCEHRIMDVKSTKTNNTWREARRINQWTRKNQVREQVMGEKVPLFTRLFISSTFKLNLMSVAHVQQESHGQSWIKNRMKEQIFIHNPDTKRPENEFVCNFKNLNCVSRKYQKLGENVRGGATIYNIL